MKTKPKIIKTHCTFLIVVLMLSQHTFAQCGFTYNYPNATPWTITGTSSFVPVLTVGPSSFNFLATPGGGCDYAYMTTPCTPSNNGWCADIDFTYTARSTSGVAHTLLSFTSDTLNSWNTCAYAVSNNDDIEAYLLSPLNGGASTDSIFGRSKLGNVWNAPSKGIAVVTGNTYFIRLQRLSPTQGLISVFTTAARTTQVAGSPQCFPINAAVAGLSILQHGAIPQAGPMRWMTGSLANLAVNDIVPGITGITSPLCGPTVNVNLCVSAICGSNNTYNWTGPAGFSVTSGQGTPCITAHIVGYGTKTVTCTITPPGAAACGVITYTTTFTVNAPPWISVSASPSSTICYGSSTTLTASGASTYFWMPGSLTGSSVTVSPTSTTTYTVTGTSTAGCTRSIVTTVTVDPPLTANAGPNDTTCCGSIWWLGNGASSASGGTQFASPPNPYPYNYSWSPTTNFTGCTNCPNPTVMSCNGAPGPVTYTLTVTDALGCTATSTVTIWYNYCRLANPNANQNQQSTAAIANEMSIAPNPTNGNFVITLPGAALHDVEVVDVLGKIVYSKQGIADASLTVDLSAQPKGIYFVKCREGGQTFVQRIVIQ